MKILGVILLLCVTALPCVSLGEEAGVVIHINSMGDFDRYVRHADKPALVDFYADWCPPCKQLAPVIEKLAADYKDALNVCKVNVDKNGELAAEFQIQGIPDVLFFKGGKMAERLVGLRHEKAYRELIEKNTER